MKAKIIFALSIFLFYSCTNGVSQKNTQLGQNDRLTTKVSKVPSSVKTNLNCLPDDPIYTTGGLVSDAEKFAISMAGVTVSDKEESDLGDEAYAEMKSSGEHKFINSGARLAELERMLKDLLATRSNPSGIRYKIHLIFK